MNIPQAQDIVGENLVNQALMLISCPARNSEGILNGADVQPARMLLVSSGAEVLVDSSFVRSITISDQIMGVNL